MHWFQDAVRMFHGIIVMVVNTEYFEQLASVRLDVIRRETLWLRKYSRADFWQRR